MGGGNNNNALGNYATVGGGFNNTASGAVATVGGGMDNAASGTYATVGGGDLNTASGYAATVGGGYSNDASAYSATVPGGYDCNAGGEYSLAAGSAARTTTAGTFVWADSSSFTGFDFNTANAFGVRASGGVKFYSNSAATTGVSLAPGGGSWTDVSDRNVKDNVAPVAPEAVLDKVAALPISTWNYESQDPSIRHMGPMAQDMYAAFGLGESDTGIDTIDADGVALAAIQGLNQRLNQKLAAQNDEIQGLDQRLAARNDEVQGLNQRLAAQNDEMQGLKNEMAELKGLVKTLAQAH